MSESTRYRWSIRSHQAYLERQAARERRHQEYLERQAAREERHEAYLLRQAEREERHQDYLVRQEGRAARQQEYFDRIQENTGRYRARYETMLSDMVRQGLEEYMPNEFAEIRSQLAKLDDLADSNPEQARDVSLHIGAELSRIATTAKSARHEFESRERKRQQELSELRRKSTSELAQYIQSVIASFSDPIEQDFAFDKLKALQEEYGGRVVDVQELSSLKDEIGKKSKIIQGEASAQAKAWKERKSQETVRESQELLIGIHREHALAESGAGSGAVQSLLATLDAMRAQIGSQESSMDAIQKSLSKITEQTDTAVADENCRRMVVRSIMDSLEKSGFIVGKPQRQAGDADEVIILARRPAGAEATFRVTADGGMIYKFDHYEGMKCKSDIDQVLPMLQEIYGVELSDARVLWQNPDRISQSARPISDGSKEQHHG